MGIKVYRSDQAGAPVLSGTNGSLIALLDACLVNGFGQVNVSTLSRVGNVVTMGFITPHNFGSFEWITVAGADQLDYNAEFQVTRIDAYQVSFTVTGEPVTPATGSIIAKRAPAGFAKPFAGTNRAVYRATDMSSRRHFYRVIDDGASGLGGRSARIRGYEVMTGIDDGALPFPQITQISGDGLYLLKSDASNTTAKAWILASDGKTVYLMLSPTRAASDFTADSNSQLNAFGEYSTFVSDAYASFLSGMESEDVNGSNSGVLRVSGDNNPNTTSRNSAIAVARNFSGNPGAIYGVSHLGHALGSQMAIGSNAPIPYPNLPDNRYYMSPVLMYDPGGYLRAKLPGAYESLHGRTHSQGQVIGGLNVVGMEKRRFVFLGGRSHNYNYFGGIFLDLTGPWETT